ncbi:hypothetical protein SteCoe_16895 [Stentor coeruleus]|uniref:Uncharacterized protein n=1 Tax=Stentor coeruleus TaxID=5963 RepID=A0A1R2C0A1_9CILI|nr:hypothetical protein SteCoe_16895 [Stentor coeruleus]
MNSAFQERFKNRLNFIGKQGNIDLTGSASIQKPLNSQIFHNSYQPVNDLPEVSKVLERYSTTTYEIPSCPSPIGIKDSPSQSHKQPQSAKTYKIIEKRARSDLYINQYSKPISEYKPYTLIDYQNIKSDKYYELGGLGPSYVGTEDWKLKKEMFKKRVSYGKQVMQINSNLPPSYMRKPIKPIEKDISKMDKGKKFARMIPKPLSKDKNPNSKSMPAVSSVLEELEQQHIAYKASVGNIWHDYR